MTIVCLLVIRRHGGVEGSATCMQFFVKKRVVEAFSQSSEGSCVCTYGVPPISNHFSRTPQVKKGREIPSGVCCPSTT